MPWRTHRRRCHRCRYSGVQLGQSALSPLMGEFPGPADVVPTLLDSPLEGGYLDSLPHPLVHTTKGMAIFNGVVKTHSQAVRTTRGKDHALCRTRNNDWVGKADGGPWKKSLSSPFIPGVRLEWFLVSFGYHPNRHTILFSSARSFSNRDGGMCGRRGLPLNLGRCIEGRTPCSSCCPQEGRRGLRLGSITRRCAGSAWNHRHLTLGSSLDDCKRVGLLQLWLAGWPPDQRVDNN